MNKAEMQVIIQQQIKNIQQILEAEVSTSIVTDNSGKCQYKLTFTYDKDSYEIRPND